MAKEKEVTKKAAPAKAEAAPKATAKAEEKAVGKPNANLAALVGRANEADGQVRGSNGANVNFLSLCQKQAHALEEDDPLYIEGVAVKDFYIQAKKLKLGKELRVVPLAVIDCYNEQTRDKIPKFLGVWHKDDAEKYELDMGSFYNRALDNGNVLQPVTWFVLYLVDHPEIEKVVLTFKSTGQKVAKAWRKEIDACAKASCELIYDIKAETVKNDDNSWLQVAFELDGRVYKLSKAGEVLDAEDFAEEVLTKSAAINEAYVTNRLIARRSGTRDVTPATRQITGDVEGEGEGAPEF